MGHYPCEVKGCGKLFTRSDHLLRHVRNHDNSVYYECDWRDCGKKFKRKDVLNKHIKIHERQGDNSKSHQKNNIKFQVYTPDNLPENLAANSNSKSGTQ